MKNQVYTSSVDPSTLPSGATIINEGGDFVPVKNLKNNIFWVDFSDPAATIENLENGSTLKIGTKYTKELSPDYFVTLEVVELKPWEINEGNTFRPDHSSKANQPANVIVRTPDSKWSHLLLAGLLDSNGKSAFGSSDNYANIGFTFKVTATYKGIK